MDDGPSKSQIKREMLALTAAGREIVELSPANLKKIPLDDEVLAAVLAAQNMKMAALKRQLQFIGKLLRKRDCEPILAALEGIKTARQSLGHANKQLEKWRLRLLDDGNALTEFCQAYPQANVQRLRQLIRHAQKEREQQKPPRYFRELYQEIKASTST